MAKKWAKIKSWALAMGQGVIYDKNVGLGAVQAMHIAGESKESHYSSHMTLGGQLYRHIG